MAVPLVSCKNTVKLLYAPAKYMCNVLVNAGVFADFVFKRYTCLGGRDWGTDKVRNEEQRITKHSAETLRWAWWGELRVQMLVKDVWN